MFSDYIGAVFLIFFAEMGDKTQFLAMAFATKYPVRKILIGVAIGSALNHGLAMVLGKVLLQFMPGELISFIAGLMFIYFAFMSLKIDDEEIEESKVKYGAVITVALAFFLGELGDKTQLAALGLAVDSDYVSMVLMGTVTGMILTSSLGIFVGIKLGKKIPEDKLKMSAFMIFIIFGVEKLYNSYLATFSILVLLSISALFTTVVVYALMKFKKSYASLETSLFVKQAEALKKTKEVVILKVDNMCKGIEECISCDGDSCMVGYMKDMLKSTIEPISDIDGKKINALKDKSFKKNEAIEIIEVLVEYYERYESEYKDNLNLLNLRKVLEVIVFGELVIADSFSEYKQSIKNIDSVSSQWS